MRCQRAIANVHYSKGPLQPQSIIAKVSVRGDEFTFEVPIGNNSAMHFNRVSNVMSMWSLR